MDVLSLGDVDWDGNRPAAVIRARIVDAARTVLAGAGEMRLNAVAKAAGVGQGTLYRHFATREALLAAVYEQDVDTLVAAAHELLAAREPADALVGWFDLVVEHARVKRGVLSAIEASAWRNLAAGSVGPIDEAVTALIEAGQAAGTVRTDVDARDVLLLIGYLTRLEEAEWDARARRLLGVVLDGLAA